MFRIVVLAAAAFLGVAHIAAAQNTSNRAVTFQQDSRHSGSAVGTGVTPPLRRRWARSTNGVMAAPLIADGKVFVVTATANQLGSELHAFDSATGDALWGPVPLADYDRATAAYDAGTVFALVEDETLRAFDAQSGVARWTFHFPRQTIYSSYPVARDGLIFAMGDGQGATVFAIDQATGTLRWEADADTGSSSTPAVTEDGVFIDSGCGYSYRFNAGNGNRVWSTSGNCYGGGSDTVAIHGDRAFMRDGLYRMLDIRSGERLGRFDSSFIPAFWNETAIFRTYGGRDRGVRAVDLKSGAMLWSFSFDPFADDGGITTESHIVDGIVYIGDKRGVVHGIDIETGKVVWSDDTGQSVQVFRPFNAAEGILVVPVGFALFAYESVSPQVFDVCIEDDRTGDRLDVNSVTGEFRFIQCRTGRNVAGVGSIGVSDPCVLKLAYNGRDKLRATIRTCDERAKANVTLSGVAEVVRIKDSNLEGNACACP